LGRFVGITGTPGTGKKTLAPLVARTLGLQCIGLNDLLTKREKTKGTFSVDPAKMRRQLLERTKGRWLVYGHLLPDVLEERDVERVVVLRCDPEALKRRLQSRGYSQAKLASNVEAELIGLIASDCFAKFGRSRVTEFDSTSRSKSDSAKSVARLLGRRLLRGHPVDWLGRYASPEKLTSLLSAARTESAFT
jgi:adenylate kinase